MAQVSTTQVSDALAKRNEWASPKLRLDPFQLPHRVSFEREAGFSYTIDRNGASLKRQLHCGLPVSMALPAQAFRGIAAKVEDLPDGTLRVTLELYHHDRALCLPVLVSDNLDDIAADWHAWSRMLKLPMLIISEDDMAEPVRDELDAIMVEDPIARRRRLTTIKHRPNFLRRRKTGIVGKVEKISAAELIARR